LVFAALFALLAYSVLIDPTSRNLTATLSILVMSSLFIAALAYLFSLRVSIHPYGISKQSWVGTKEMRWDDVERFYYNATRRSVNFIPIGTYYYFKLVDREGNKIVLSNTVERPAELGQRLIGSTSEPLFRKAAQLFDSGEKLKFGPVSLSRENGLEIKRLFQNKKIPLEHVWEYRIADGRLYIFKTGDKRTTGPSISRVPNVFVLKGLLDAIYHPRS